METNLRGRNGAEIQHFRSENTRSYYNKRIIMIYMWFTSINYCTLAVEKDRDFSFMTITTKWKPDLLDII